MQNVMFPDIVKISSKMHASAENGYCDGKNSSYSRQIEVSNKSSQTNNVLRQFWSLLFKYGTSHD